MTDAVHRRRVVILGSTGSIGKNALAVAAALPDRLEVVALAACRQGDTLLDQARQFGVRHVALSDSAAAQRLARDLPAGVTLYGGETGVTDMVTGVDADVVLCAVSGVAGLRPTLAALAQGTDVAISTKEVLVAAGSVVTAAAAASGARLLPVDSEHSAVFQCIQGAASCEVARLLLTASGGPFLDRPNIDFDRVTVAEALDHPRWRMGPKVTIDSATLMNKGLEIMEAQWLFGIDVDRIEVVVHPQSIVHSMVAFVDGNVLAQLSPPDMRYAIQYALTYPDRVDGRLPAFSPAEIGALTFQQPDLARFPCLGLAREAAGRGGTSPAVLNAANEIAVSRFLKGDIAFSSIWRIVGHVLDRHDPAEDPDLDAVLAADDWGRAAAWEFSC